MSERERLAEWVDGVAREVEELVSRPPHARPSAIDVLRYTLHRHAAALLREQERCDSCNAGPTDPCAYPTENAKRLQRRIDELEASEQEREPDAWEIWDAGAMWILDRMGHKGGRPSYETSREAFQNRFGTQETESEE